MTTPNLTDQQNKTIDSIVELLSSDMRLFIVTGAGMSAESGLPTYRGTGGLYNSGRTEQGMRIEELLSGGTFRRDPKLTWKYLGEIGQACVGKQHNRGHTVLAEMESAFVDFCILTQNIDGFHREAGSNNVIEIHGNLHDLRCDECQFRKTVEKFSDIEIPPYCDKCTKMLRPDVVLFDEMLPAAACDRLAGQWQSGFDAVFSIGTTSNFPYIAEPICGAAGRGLPAIEINPSTTNVSQHCSHRLDLPASIALNEIWKRYQ